MSYGTNAPFGLQPRFYLNGSTYNDQQSEYFINGNVTGGGTSYATSIFQGDLVTLLSDGTIGLVAAGNNNPSIGVFMGCKYFDSTNTLIFSKYWPSATPTFNATNPIAFVVDDPNVLFDAQVSGTGLVTGNVNTINYNGTTSDLNWNYKINLGSGGSTISGQSGTFVDLATQANTATYQVKLIRLTPRPGNTFGLQFNNGLFLINNHVYKGGTGTAGV